MFDKVLLVVFVLFFQFSLLFQISSPAYAQSVLCEQKEINLVFMLDVTGSSRAEQIAQQKKAIRKVLRFFTKSSVKPSFALGHFNTEAEIVQPLTDDYVLLRNKLQSDIPDEGTDGTHIHLGLTAASEELTAGTPGGDHKLVMLFSDGQSQTEEEDVEVASGIKGSLKKIFAVHYDHFTNEDIDKSENHMREIASSPEKKFYKKVYGDLALSILELISKFICDEGDSVECEGSECDLKGDSNGDGLYNDTTQGLFDGETDLF